MPMILQSLLLALAVGGVAWAVIIPLVRMIPLQMEMEWREQLISLEETLPEPGISSEQIFLTQRVAVCAVAVGIGLLIFTLRGINVESAILLVYLLGQLLLATINLRTGLLPDKVALPLLWGGLLYHASQGQGVDQVYGAVAGYCIPYFLHAALKAITRKDLVGRGDMKTFAMAGAWLGATALPSVFLTFILAANVLLMAKKIMRRARTSYELTGPAHLLASLLYIAGVRLV